MTVWVTTATLAFALASAAPALAQGGRRGGEPHPGRQPQGRHAGQWLRQNKNKPPEQQRKALENDPQFRRLAPQQKQQLRNQLQRFNNMPPEKQQQMLNRMDTWGHLTQEQKDQARQIHSQMQQLPPERHQAVNNAIKALRGMPPEARQREIDSDAYKKQFSPQERDILGGASRLPLAPPESSVPKPPGQ
jgi:hypothetical protein